MIPRPLNNAVGGRVGGGINKNILPRIRIGSQRRILLKDKGLISVVVYNAADPT